MSTMPVNTTRSTASDSERRRKHGHARFKIFLTRHGQSEANTRDQLGGNSTITALGEGYASRLPGTLLACLPNNGEGLVVKVWTSTLARTIATARHLPFEKHQCKGLDEISAGDFEHMTYEEIAATRPKEAADRKRDKLRNAFPNGESYLDLLRRVEPVNAALDLECASEYVCVVAHQAVLRVVYSYFMDIPLEQVPHLDIPLHTLMELTPMPDGTMHEQRHAVNLTSPAPELGQASLPTLPCFNSSSPLIPQQKAVTAKPRSGWAIPVEVNVQGGAAERSVSCATTVTTTKGPGVIVAGKQRPEMVSGVGLIKCAGTMELAGVSSTSLADDGVLV